MFFPGIVKKFIFLKGVLTVTIKNSIINNNRTHHASDYHAQPGGTFLFMEYVMY